MFSKYIPETLTLILVIYLRVKVKIRVRVRVSKLYVLAEHDLILIGTAQCVLSIVGTWSLSKSYLVRR